MNIFYKINYADGKTRIIIAKNIKEVVKQYDLTTKENIKTKVIRLPKVNVNYKY